MRQALIVAGPTCSGKSALALALAVRLGGTVINADSMQVYRELRVLTARPSPADEAAAPHRLYGVLPAAEAGSVAWWRRSALAEMERAALPILCGGTGLYLQSLTQGLSDIPDPGPARAEARDLLAEIGAAALHGRLAAADPATAAILRPSDGQRVARAWEVWRSTGRGLVAWQGAAGPPAPFDWTVIRLDPPREAVRRAAASRFDAMLAQGALDEVRALLALRLDPGLPAMRAHGVRELAEAIDGRTTLALARQRSIDATTAYIKRQATWFRNRQFAGQTRTRIIRSLFQGNEQDSESLIAEIISFIRQPG